MCVVRCHKEKNMNEKEILEFIPENATDDQIRVWLFAIINQELEKPEGQEDVELIGECLECEMYLVGSESTLTEMQYLAGLAEIKKRAAIIGAKKTKKHRVLRRLSALIAAVVASVLFTMGVVAYNNSAAEEFIVTHIKQIVSLIPGKTLEGDRITLIKDDVVDEYASVEEALRAGGFEGILYPTALPEGVKIEQIVLSTEGDKTKYEISFVFTTKDILYGVSNYEIIGMHCWENTEIINIHNRQFFVVYIENADIYQAGYYDQGYEHILKCSDYNTLIDLLNSMEELKK